jgi:DNA-binding transcriptional LysR family regulator
MELRHLEYFIAVAQERHFTRAAQRLMVSQSGLSASVRALERELGAQLFVRSTRSVELTAPGRALLAEALRTVASVRAAKEAVAEVQGLLRGTLSAGTEQCVTGVNVAALLARFRGEHPQVQVRLRQANSAALAEDVAAGRLDLAFVALHGAPPEGVRLLPLTQEPMVLLCHPGHRLSGTARVPWGELDGETFVDFHPDWGSRCLTDSAFEAAGTARRVALEVNDVHSLIDMVGHGLGIAVVPRPLALKDQAAGLSWTPLADLPLWRVAVAAPDADRLAPAARELLSYLGLSDGPAPSRPEGAEGSAAGPSAVLPSDAGSKHAATAAS